MGSLTTMANNLIEVLASVPPTLAAAWGVWFVAGGVLTFWYRRAALAPQFVPVPAPSPRSGVRSKSSVRTASSMSREVAPVMPVEEAPPVAAYEPPPGVAPVVARDKKPVVIGDPFGDLATLLDQPQSVPAATSHRAPGDSPILSSAGSPLRRNDGATLS